MAEGCQFFVKASAGRQEAEFCEQQTLPGSSYCQQHHKRIWRRPDKHYRDVTLAADVDNDTDDDGGPDE